SSKRPGVGEMADQNGSHGQFSHSLTRATITWREVVMTTLAASFAFGCEQNRRSRDMRGVLLGSLAVLVAVLDVPTVTGKSAALQECPVPVVVRTRMMLLQLLMPPCGIRQSSQGNYADLIRPPTRHVISN